VVVVVLDPVVVVVPDPVVVVVPEAGLVVVVVDPVVLVLPEVVVPVVVVVPVTLVAPGLFLTVSLQLLWCPRFSEPIGDITGVIPSSFLHDVMAISETNTIPTRDQTCLRHGFRAVTFILGSLINYWARIRR
jgi:hypothetical protein